MNQLNELLGLRNLRCLVTGACGVLGRALTDLLEVHGAEVRALDRRVGRPTVGQRLQWIEGDAADPGLLASATEGVDVVFHLAGALPQANLDDDGFLVANVGPTEVVVRASSSAGVRRVVLASTIEVYGVRQLREPLTEDAPTRCAGAYSRSKLQAEHTLFRLAGRFGVEPVVLRLPMILGPGFYHEPSVFTVLRLLDLGLPVPVPGRGELPVSYVSSRDAAQAFARAALGEAAPWNVFNIAASDTPTMAQLFTEVAAKIGSSSRPLSVPMPVVRAAVGLASVAGRRRGSVLGTPVELVGFALTGGAYDTDAARSALRYRPVDTCADAWEALYRWWVEHVRRGRRSSPRGQHGTS